VAAGLKRLLKRFLVTIAGNRAAQRILQANVAVSQYLMGIGAGHHAGVSGERILAARLLGLPRPAGRPLCVVDVGANEGQFLDVITRELGTTPCHIHAFEPGRHAFDVLRTRFGDRSAVTLNNMALGRLAEERDLFYDTPGTTVASLYPNPPSFTSAPFHAGEKVRVDTLDNYCQAHSVETIDLLKIDVEGHELAVLEGATRVLGRRQVNMISFEFGPWHVEARTFFQDIFRFLQAHGMGTIFRITPSGYLVGIDRYRETQEQFRTTNYLALPGGA